MGLIDDAGRIRGTDPRVREVTDRIGRGYRPTGRRRMTADHAAEAAGRTPSDQAVNDDFARRLSEMADDKAQQSGGRRRYFHETDEANARSILTRGIQERPDKADPEGRKGVFAHTEAHDPPEGRVRFEFEAPPDEVRGHGTGGNTSAVFRRSIPVEDIKGIRRSRPSLHIPGGTGTVSGIVGLYSMLAPMLGLPYIQTPADWVLNDVMRQNYSPGGAMDPYRDYTGPRDPQTGDILA